VDEAQVLKVLGCFIEHFIKTILLTYCYSYI